MVFLLVVLLVIIVIVKVIAVSWLAWSCYLSPRQCGVPLLRGDVQVVKLHEPRQHSDNIFAIVFVVRTRVLAQPERPKVW